MKSISRRNFLHLLAGSAGTLALSRYFEPSLLMAQSVGSGAGKNFFVVNLFGGVDGMSLFPYYQGPLSDLIHSQLRPTIAVS